MDYHELRTKTVAELREIAAGIEGVTGYSQLNKPALLELLCKKLGIDMHEHHQVVGIDKTTVKQRIRALKAERDAALARGDAEQRRRAQQEIHRLKRRLRRAMV